MSVYRISKLLTSWCVLEEVRRKEWRKAEVSGQEHKRRRRKRRKGSGDSSSTNLFLGRNREVEEEEEGEGDDDGDGGGEASDRDPLEDDDEFYRDIPLLRHGRHRRRKSIRSMDGDDAEGSEYSWEDQFLEERGVGREDRSPLDISIVVEIGLQVMEVIRARRRKKEREIYKKFVACFKSHCTELGYSLEDVMQQLAIRYGQMVTRPYIQGFEDLVLSRDSYGPLMEILKSWISDTAKAAGTSEKDLATMIYPQQNRKQKTRVSTQVTLRLEEAFSLKRNPIQTEIQHLAQELGVERTWFKNRRWKEKIMGKRPMEKQDVPTRVVEKSPSPNTTLEGKPVISSSLYDITVVVPSIHPRDVGSSFYAANCVIGV